MQARAVRVYEPLVHSMRPPLACDILPPLPAAQSPAPPDGRTLAYLFLLESDLPRDHALFALYQLFHTKPNLPQQ